MSEELVAPTIFAALRRTSPSLTPRLLPKTAMTAISHAIEDECLARGERPVLIGSFQEERFYRQSERRWRELARQASLSVAFAQFDQPQRGVNAPIEVPLAPRSAMGREWAVISVANDYTACLAGWERPRQRPAADRDRAFEAVWTTEPASVREAARVCADMAATTSSDTSASIREQLNLVAPAERDVLLSTVALSNRIGAYLVGQH